MANYRFLTVWVLDAPTEKVWDAISDYKHFPTWWKAVRQVVEIESGGSDDVGSVWRMTWKTPLSYTLTFDSRITRVDPPTLLELTASGEVEGTGRWELSATDSGTLVRYYWTVRTTKAWMNMLAIFIRPLMKWNHNAIMQQGGQALAQFLGARLYKAEAIDVERLAPTLTTQDDCSWKIKLLYDGECPLCLREVNFLKKRDAGRGLVAFVDIADNRYTPEAHGGVDYETAMGRIHAVLPDGTIVKNVEVFRRVYEILGMGWVYAATRLPIIGPIVDKLYEIWADWRLALTGRPDLATIVANRQKSLETKPQGRCRLNETEDMYHI